LRPRVCEPFFTTKPPGKGTGLGLSVTYSIVQRHGGTLDIASNGERGTRVTLRVPLRIEAVPNGAPPITPSLVVPAPRAVRSENV
jgi:two-component system NtrC family sensor kinase